MSLKPIDLLTNMNQLHEVAKNQHHADNAALAQQLQLDKESGEKSQLSDKTVDETKNASETVDNNSGGTASDQAHHGEKKKQDASSPSHQHKPLQVEDEKLGANFDIRK